MPEIPKTSIGEKPAKLEALRVQTPEEEAVKKEALKMVQNLQKTIEEELKDVSKISVYKTKDDCSARYDKSGKILDYIK